MANARIQIKRDTTAHWNAALGFVPLDGELIIYTDYRTETVVEDGKQVVKDVPGMKIGDGKAYVQDLPFQSGVSEKDIEFWNNKVNIDDSNESAETLVGETLVFTRN